MTTTPEVDYTRPAAEATIEKVAAALTANNIEAVIVEDGAEARAKVLERIPEGALVHSAKSKTLEDIGVFSELTESGRYDAIRPRYMAMDRASQGDEIRRLMATPDWMVGSVQALTEDGTLVVVSYSGSQIGPYAASAGHVIFVVGSQKIVPDLEMAMTRVREHAFPYENERLMKDLGVPTKIAKTLLIQLEARPGRTTVFLVREPVGV
jgi:L-lactate utilization protein LutC